MVDLILFERSFYLESVSSCCVGAYFESWAKFLGFPLMV